jgi:hypothetical protein
VVQEQPNVHLDKFKQMATNTQNFVREAEPKGQSGVMATSEAVRGLELNEMDRQEVGADMLAVQPTPTIQETPSVAQSPPVTAEAIENAGQATGSPIQMDAAMQEQGRELQELMRMFRQSTTTPLSECVLQTPSHKAKLSENTPAEKEKTQTTQRKSPRLKAKKKSDKSIIKLARDLVAKKCGILQEDEEMEQLTLQQYIDMYKQPLSDKSMEAIIKLTEVSCEKQKKKKKSKKDKAQEEVKMLHVEKKSKKGKKAPVGAEA